MAIERPTFHEAWYRVAQLRPRLLTGVRIYRQQYRGQLWYVVENPANNQFSRVSEEAYLFLGLLDGRRTVRDVWHTCNERLDDRAPTQGEIIQLLGQLHAANLLYVELPPDSEALFSRYRKRVRREVTGYLTNLLFVRIPLLDPDKILNRWVGLLGLPFSLTGLFLWLLLLGAGLYVIIGNFGDLVSQSSDVLDPDNILLLYLSMVLTKVIHEFSHAFACKRFGRLNGNAGEVHKMGVMFLIFFPLPYVDASSAWTFRSKWHRAVVGMAGVMAELAVAAVAAIVWASTSTGTLHIIAFNVIFVASVSTLFFNGNPLLRFDAYYVLSDLIEIPNLAQRCRQYLHYLFKRYVWGLKRAWNPAFTVGERLWFVFYGCAAISYRIFISVRILLFLNDRLPDTLSVLVPALAFSALVGWVLVPLAKFLRVLATGTELTRNRGRAIGSTGVLALSLMVLLGFIRCPDYCRVEGVLEPVELSTIHAATDGFVTSFLPSRVAASPTGPPLIQAVNPALSSEEQVLTAGRRALEIRRRKALTREVAAAQILEEQLAALDDKIERVQQELASLSLAAPSSGTWVSPQIEYARGRYVRRGEEIGVVAKLDDLLVRATAGQNIAAMLVEQAEEGVEIRANGRPELTIAGTIEQIYPAGQGRLPSQALGYAVGGSVPVDLRDPTGTTAAEKFFEVRIRLRWDDSAQWLTGQRVVVRVRLKSKSLARQVWHYGRQLFQRRYHI